MAQTLFTKVDYTLSTLLSYIEMGDVGLPEIQRPFVWPNTKVRDLFDSMYRGFPVGYLLFWVNGLSGDHRQIGADKKQKAARLLIVDGQQRLTSLYAVLKGIEVVRADYRKERITIAFRPRDMKFEVTDVTIRRDAEWIPDISEIWRNPEYAFTKAFLERQRAVREVSDEEANKLADAISRVYELHNYPFTALELIQQVNEEQVADVFVRINSKGTPLNQADFILTLMSVFWDQGRMELERFCYQTRQPSTSGASPYNHFIKPDPDQLLRVSVGVGFRRARLENVYSILRGKDLQTGAFSEERRDEQFAVLKEAQAFTLDVQHWHDFLKAIMYAGYRSEAMITSQTALLYAYVLWLIGKREYQLDIETLRRVIARWFFMSSMTARYGSSPESTMEQDLARLRGVTGVAGFVATLDRVVADTLTDDFWSIGLPNGLATSSARTPSLFAYYAALNLLSARVLFSQLSVSDLLDPSVKAKRAAAERHHLFPKGYLRRIGISDLRDINQIANFALVEWDINTKISDRAPADYFPTHVARVSEAELAQMRYWHALPEGWEHLKYSEFLDARCKAIAGVIRDGFDKLRFGMEKL